MPAHSKDLTKRVTLRHTDDEDTMIANVVSAYAEAGITISRNDAVRVCIRIGSTPVPKDVETARRAVLDHVERCAHCTGKQLGCPEGHWLWDLHTAVVARAHISKPRPAPEPSPAPHGPLTGIAKAVSELPQDPGRRPRVPRLPVAPIGRRLTGS